MIRFVLDLGQVPSVLQSLQDPAIAAQAAKRMAESYTDDTLSRIEAGHAFEPHQAGGLEQSINWRPTSEGAEVYVNADYAAYVEFGTGIPAGHQSWVIEPRPGRKGLKIPVAGPGGYIVRRRVTHPGSRPFPYFFADSDNRNAHMITAARSVLAAHAGGGHG